MPAKKKSDPNFGGAPVYLLLGRTGSGKSSLAAALRKKIGLPSISLGEIARAEMAKGTVLGKKAQGALGLGKPFSSDLAIKMVESALKSNPKKFENGVILDNFPMKLGHVKVFEALCKSLGLRIERAFHVHAPRSAADARRGQKPRGESGASPEAREHQFQIEGMKVVMHFKQRGLLTTLDATRAISLNTRKVKAVHKAWKRRQRRGK